MDEKLTYYDIFLKTGILYTLPISYYSFSLTKKLLKITEDFRINIDYTNETFYLEILSIIDYEKFKSINSICNNFGYFLTRYKKNDNNILIYNPSEFEKKINNNNILFLYYETKYEKLYNQM